MFKFILICLLIFLVVKLIQSYTRPATDGYSSKNRNTYKRREGDVFVDINSDTKKKKFSKTEGEYIDYEDV
jgi:hypothetical protein